ncbi:hypothetical protein ACP4OV_012254 [Aristida adscensionis]
MQRRQSPFFILAQEHDRRLVRACGPPRGSSIKASNACCGNGRARSRQQLSTNSPSLEQTTAAMKIGTVKAAAAAGAMLVAFSLLASGTGAAPPPAPSSANGVAQPAGCLNELYPMFPCAPYITDVTLSPRLPTPECCGGLRTVANGSGIICLCHVFGTELGPYLEQRHPVNLLRALLLPALCLVPMPGQVLFMCHGASPAVAGPGTAARCNSGGTPARMMMMSHSDPSNSGATPARMLLQ